MTETEARAFFIARIKKGGTVFYPTVEEAQHIADADDFRCIPVACEILSDVRTPIEVMRVLKGVSNHCFMLESAEATENERWGRYTFLGYDPLCEITVRDGVVCIDGQPDALAQPGEHPAQAIRRVLEAHKAPRLEAMPPFAGGLVGYFSYDYLKYSEPTLELQAADDEGFNDVDLMLFDKVICFDNYRQKIICIAHASTDNLQDSYEVACRTLEEMVSLVRTGTPVTATHGTLGGDFTRLFSEDAYCDIVRRTQEYIHEGDIFQAVLSNRLQAPFEGSLLDTYRILRASNPSPYMFYFTSSSIELAGASPETLVKLHDGVLHTFPLAGTRPRGATPEEDAQLERSLLADEKELAEHNMLVDLGRNDLGRVCEFGSVDVEDYLQVLRFSHVMHLGSTVRGTIRPGCDALDAIDAVLPAGTLSGAPKIRAAQIIDELENCKRGVYGGAIGYIDLAGNMDTCIAIRLAYALAGRVFVRSGAGIVADSDPATENRECIAKAAAVMEALKAAEGGLA